MRKVILCWRTAVAFGDLFLQDIRDYRVRQLEGSGLEPLFPVWQIPTQQLSRDMIVAGVRAKITCVDPSKLAKSFDGRDYDLQLLQALPAGVDPCGENGNSTRLCMMRPCSLAPSECRREKWSSAMGLCLPTCFRDGRSAPRLAPPEAQVCLLMA